MSPTVPPAKPLPAAIRDRMSQGVPLHKAVGGASAKASGPKIRVGK